MIATIGRMALVGDNGAGKSTLIKHISGVYKADAGEIRLNRALLDLHGPADARRLGIETVYQDLALADDLSIGANVFLGREPVRRWLGLLAVIEIARDETHALLARIESRIPPKARTVSRTIGGCFLGAILFTTIGNGANLLGVNPFWQMVNEGLLIAGVVYLDNVQKRRAQGQ